MRLLAVDDLRRDRRPTAAAADRRGQPRPAARPRSTRPRRTTSRATSRRWTVTTTGPYSVGPVLHPALARPATRTRRSPTASATASIDARPALGGRRRLPRADAARRPPGERPGRPRLADGGRRRRSSARPRAARASTATAPAGTAARTATATATIRARPSCSPTGEPWPPTDTRGPATCGRAVRRARRIRPAPTGDTRRRRGAARRDARTMTSGQGLEPEQAWENPDVPASPFGTDPDDRLDRLRHRPAGRLGEPAHVGAAAVRAAHHRPRRGARAGDARASSLTATSRTACRARSD